MLHVAILLAIAIFNSAYITESAKSYAITTLINAKWAQPPLYLEIAEYLSDENPSLYWEFIDKIVILNVSLEDLDVDSKQYIKSIEIAKNLIGERKTSLLKLAVAMHTLTPRIHTYMEIAKPLFEIGNCNDSNFAVVNNEVICSVEELATELNRIKTTNNVEIYSFDHIFAGSENNTLPVFLYGDIGSSKFALFHNYLKKEALKRNVQYVSRHFLKIIPQNKVRLSGYGVELHLKSTEYKSQDDSHRQEETTKFDEIEPFVEGFNFQFLKTNYPELEYSLQRFRNNLLEKSEELAPLKAWEFQDLGLQAAQRISEIQGEESLNILQYTVQNFPTQAKSLVLQKVSSNFKNEMKHNIEVFGRSLNLQPPDAALFINGLFFDVDTLDLSALLETLISEIRVLDDLHKNNITGKLASSLLALDLSSSSTKEFAIDIRDSAVMWINDIENDIQYNRWPSSVMDLLRPTFPGMLRNIKKNIFNLVLVIDPLTPNSRGLLKLSESFIIHLAPIRVGLVFDSRNQNESSKDNYRAIFCVFNYITQNKDARSALSFLTDLYATVKSDITSKDIKQQLKKSFNMLSYTEIDDILSEDSEYDYGRKLSKHFLDRLNFRNSPQALLNGVPIQPNVLNVDDFEEAVFTEVMQQTPILQKSIYRGEFNDADIPIDFLMDQAHVMPRLNQQILSTENPKYLDFSGVPQDINNINALGQLNNRDMTATLLQNLKYFNNKHSTSLFGKNVHILTIWVFADLNLENGRNLLKNALEYMNSAKNVRVAFIPNVERQDVLEKDNINKVIWAASQTLSGVEAANYTINLLENISNVDKKIPMAVNEILLSTELHLKMLRVYAQRVVNLKQSERAIIANGKIYGPFVGDDTFTIDDIGLIERCNSLNYVDKIVDIIKSSTENLDITSDILLKLFASLVPRQSKSRFTIPSDTKQNYTVIKLDPKKIDEPFFNIVAILDPASRGAQKLSSYLILLRNVINCNMRVYFCAVEQHSDMPVKNFYRFVVEPEVRFNLDGNLASGPFAKFTNLPATPLLTQNLQVPENWLVEPIRSVYDLDNIKLVDVGGPVHSEFELEYLLLEGHCFDSTTGAPPRGLQITLGTKQNPTLMDTIVMANLGYIQVKANPGIWELRLRQGKSYNIYDITSAEGPNTVFENNSAKIILTSLRSHVIKLKVNKKPEMSKVDLLGDEKEEKTGIWNSITSSFGGGNDITEPETINIFSVASGHLYERLLRIMMVSVLKHTKSPVKFWFLKNYLSPQFTDFLPAMAKKYDFQFELVQYKWPRWLHQQTEKQRTIWGYKILFLDVLFPLDVKKIIFVDADAIVRADIKELNDLDLNDAPYAYTPFCDSRKEMEGFRFWKQGYWRNHLMGRRYHISAIYVVDLKRFRKIAAGDRLRGQYQALSQDPNSLSNLDQDLPNNMIHQVAIKSLPDEWLWCQTWCSDDSFKQAKVIDLCNNPLTKEAKLTAAQRIVPEWKTYDFEIKNLMKNVLDYEMDHIENYDIENDDEVNKHSEL